MFFCLFNVVLVLSLFPCYGEFQSLGDKVSSKPQATLQFSAEETVILERFFDAIIWECEGGYVLHGAKPMCMTGFRTHDNFYGEYDSHRHGVYLKEGARLWKNIPDAGKNDVIIHIYDRPDVSVSSMIHVLVINKKIFCQTVKENLSLFQYILGPNITPETLLEKLTEPSSTFNEVLKGNKVLTGILLGFGTQNSLHVSRIEELQDGYYNYAEEIPMQNKFCALNALMGCYRDLFLLRTKEGADGVIWEPSFSYSSLKEEICDFISKIETSSPKLLQEKPNFVFGRVRGDLEGERLIKELEETQEKIIHLCSLKNRLECFLKMFFPGCEIEIEKAHSTPLTDFTPEELVHLSAALCKNIWGIICEESDPYLDGYVLGMQHAQENRKDRSIINKYDYKKLKALKIAHDNVEEADRLFAKLDQDPTLFSQEKGKVYYRTINEGFGEPLSEQRRVLIHFSAVTPEGRPLIDTWESGSAKVIDLKEAIPAFSLGIQGMRQGETREIFIHPSVGYGIYTNLEKGISLAITVELVKILPSEKSIPFTSLDSIDFSEAFLPLKEHNMDELSHSAGYLFGYAVWEHYKKGVPQFFEEVVGFLRERRASKNSLEENLSSDGDRDLMTRLHWSIYSQD